ncbi:MAG: hypothetical protein NTV73_15790 [Hyphomicrobiales bacterium]|nr:hypothetical protein [Hyphomicrobiales bacterium]
MNLHTVGGIAFRALLSLLMVVIMLQSSSARATSVTLKWASSFDDNPVSIDARGGTIYDGKLEGEKLVIETDPLLTDESPTVEATVNVVGIDDLSVGINLFKCASSCNWRIVFMEVEEPNSRLVGNICQANPKSLDGQFKKYFFCRKAYGIFFMAGGACWWEARNALTGWFDAAYKLHELTLRGGVGFIARDSEVEAKVKDSLKTCDAFEASLGRTSGYFNGMLRNLDIASLQQTQRVEKALNSNDGDGARIIAQDVVRQLDSSEPVRDAIPAKDAVYIEGVLNRALAVEKNPFSLR